MTHDACFRQTRRFLAGGALALLHITACAPSHRNTAGPSHHRSPLVVPERVPVVAAPRTVVATGIANPRGMTMSDAGRLLVSSAGAGDPREPESGRILALSDLDRDGDFDDPGEREVVLDRQPSKNILEFVHRDEVFGLGGMDRSPDDQLVTLAFFGGPSTIFRIDGPGAAVWSTVSGNINDIAYDPVRARWFGASSTNNEVVELAKEKPARRVVSLPQLESGQDAVPGYLRSDPQSGELLVSLFSGSPEGEADGTGVDLVRRSASIVAVDPDTGRVRPFLTGLTTPTDLEVSPAGELYVLEFCDAFLDPVSDRRALFEGVKHGGFRRFSGRLLRVNAARTEVVTIAEGLDAPTNLLLVGRTLYVAEGMGTPGRSIPGPMGPRALAGFIERIDLPTAP